MSKVLVSLPNQNYIHKQVAMAALRMIGDPRVKATVIMPTWKPYEHNLNRIAVDALDQDYDYWINIDADNPPLNNPIDLTLMGLDVVGCPTPVFNDQGEGYPLYMNAMDWFDDEQGWRPHAAMDGLQEVDAVGSGCMVVRVPLLERIEPPIFERTVDHRGFVEYGPDFNFCRKAKAVGGRVWAHFDYVCEHYNDVGLLNAMQKFPKPLVTNSK